MLISSSKTDFDTSIRKALKEIDPNYEKLYGIVITGSHAPLDVDIKLETIKLARENKTPILGICMGMQLMCIEYARNVLGIEDANSPEIDKETKHPVIIKLPKLRVGMKEVEGKMESHWHNYAFNLKYHDKFFDDFKFSYTDDILERIRLKDHPFFVGVQYHCEYQSSIDKPHPLLVEFLNACKKYA